MLISEVDCDACQWKPVPDVVGGILMRMFSRCVCHNTMKSSVLPYINDEVSY